MSKLYGSSVNQWEEEGYGCIAGPGHFELSANFGPYCLGAVDSDSRLRISAAIRILREEGTNVEVVVESSQRKEKIHITRVGLRVFFLGSYGGGRLSPDEGPQGIMSLAEAAEVAAFIVRDGGA